MSPFSAPVLVGAALVSSPALWNVLHGTASPELALTRYLISVVLCWMALAVVGFVVGPVPLARTTATAPVDSDAPTEQVPAV
ncbi:MAG: hypothetical protein WBQ50_16230 [Nocardioides sp.]